MTWTDRLAIAAVLAFAALLGCGVAVLLTHPVLP